MLRYRGHTDKKTWLQLMNTTSKKGVTAFKAGKKATDNPYKLGTSHHNAWESGFLSAQRDSLND